MTRRLIITGVILGVLNGVSLAWAGEVLITKCNPGSTATVWWHDGIGVNGQSTMDLNSDGDMLDPGERVVVPNQEGVLEISVTKELGFDGVGQPIRSSKVHWLEPGTLALAEPFETRTFGAMTTGKRLAPVIDVLALRQSGVTFNVGQILSVTNGTIPQTSAIRFKDVTAVSDAMIPQLFDDAFLNSQPNYTGNVRVAESDIFRQVGVPMMDSWGLIILGSLLGLGASVMVARTVQRSATTC